MGCASIGDSATGIAIPPDPTIEVPKNESPKPVVTEAPPKVESKKSKIQSKKGKKEKPVETVIEPTPQPEVKTFPTYTPDQVPFAIGEHLEMDLNWTALPAGRTVLEVRPGPVVDGRSTMLLWGNALSSRLVDTIYHVDNTIESIVDTQWLFPYKFLLHMVETHQNKETRVMFDHQKGKALYWSKRLSQKWGNEDQDRQDDVPSGTFDMWSAFYYARVLNYRMGEKHSFKVYENKQVFDVDLTPVANEFLRTPAGSFQTWKMLVNVRVNNIFRPTGDIYLWLSDDSKKYPVKFDAKIKIGSLYGILTSIRE